MPAQPPDGNELALGSGPRYSEGAMKKWEYRVLVINATADEVSEMPTELGEPRHEELAPRGGLQRTGPGSLRHNGWT
jgi:hypothetical protein